MGDAPGAAEVTAKGASVIIPEVRRRLLGIARQLEGGGFTSIGRRIRRLEKQLYRRNGTPRTPVRSRPATPELDKQIRQFKRDHPTLSIQRIGNRFKVNSARVSEALIGKRR